MKQSFPQARENGHRRDVKRVEACPVSFWRNSWLTPAFASALLKECLKEWNDKADTERPAAPERSRITPASMPAFAMMRLNAIGRPLLPLPGLP